MSRWEKSFRKIFFFIFLLLNKFSLSFSIRLSFALFLIHSYPRLVNLRLVILRLKLTQIHRWMNFNFTLSLHFKRFFLLFLILFLSFHFLQVLILFLPNLINFLGHSSKRQSIWNCLWKLLNSFWFGYLSRFECFYVDWLWLILVKWWLATRRCIG